MIGSEPRSRAPGVIPGYLLAGGRLSNGMETASLSDTNSKLKLVLMGATWTSPTDISRTTRCRKSCGDGISRRTGIPMSPRKPVIAAGASLAILFATEPAWLATLEMAGGAALATEDAIDAAPLVMTDAIEAALLVAADTTEAGTLVASEPIEDRMEVARSVLIVILNTMLN